MSEDNNAAPAAAVAANDGPSPACSLRLPTFWSDTPASWFAMAECQFHLRRVSDERDKFCVLVAALTKESIRLVTNIVENPPEAPYTELKRVLLSSHQLTDFQRVEKLHQVEALGGRKPSELLAVMLEICPRGQEDNLFFQFLFLQRLPRELRIMLADDDHKDLRKLAEKADRLWALHARQSHDMIAVLEEDEEATVAAIQRGQRGNNNNSNTGRQQYRQPSQGNQKPKQQDRVSPNSLAMQSAGLCYYHWSFGERATKCKTPCSWQGN